MAEGERGRAEENFLWVISGSSPCSLARTDHITDYKGIAYRCALGGKGNGFGELLMTATLGADLIRKTFSF